jgi:hypothetical protein
MTKRPSAVSRKKQTAPAAPTTAQVVPAAPKLQPAPAPNLQQAQEELKTLDQAHLQNETNRDAFLALAHTALFAASIAFFGDLPASATPEYIYLLIGGWGASVLGLLSLTISFSAATREIDHRRQNVYRELTPRISWAALLNGVGLWTFPIALVSTFVFAGANVLQ